MDQGLSPFPDGPKWLPNGRAPLFCGKSNASEDILPVQPSLVSHSRCGNKIAENIFIVNEDSKHKLLLITKNILDWVNCFE